MIQCSMLFIVDFVGVSSLHFFIYFLFFFAAVFCLGHRNVLLKISPATKWNKTNTRLCSEHFDARSFSNNTNDQKQYAYEWILVPHLGKKFTHILGLCARECTHNAKIIFPAKATLLPLLLVPNIAISVGLSSLFLFISFFLLLLFTIHYNIFWREHVVFVGFVCFPFRLHFTYSAKHC